MGANQSKAIEPVPVNKNVVPNNEDNPSKPAEETKKLNLPLNHPKVSGSGGECPYKNPIKSVGNFFSRNKHTAVEAADSSATTSPSSAEPVSACPVKASKKNNAPSNGSACPVKSDSSKVQYNVYSQPIDPTNNMPSVANQLPGPMQNEALSTERVQSSIPKGGSDGATWTYPSPQMFYNSLARKNKLGDTEESDIESVVAIHNNMNEKTWAKVMEWEDVLCPEGKKDGGSKLLKFMGRPSDLSVSF